MGFLNVIVLYFALIIFYFILIDKGVKKRLVIIITTIILLINTATGTLSIVNFIMEHNGTGIVNNLKDGNINPWFVTIFTAAAGICIAGAFIHQVILTYKTKNVKNISLPTSIIYTIGNSLYILYFIFNISASPSHASAWAPSLISVSITAILQVALIIWKIQWGNKKSESNK